MIVVEGPDGSGKTTLCKWICKQFNLEMGERATKNRDEIYKTTREDTWNALGYELHCVMPPFVWDRIGPYSDPIYSANAIPNRRDVAFTPGEVNVFDFAMRRLGCVILCLPPLKVVLENVELGHQLEGVPMKTADIYHAYEATMGHHFKYDYTNSKLLHQVALRVSVHFKMRKAREHLAGNL